MKAPSEAPRPRIELIDVLRGSALCGLFLLHCVEHFEIGGGPASSPQWLGALDGQLRNGAFMLFSGKAYGLFAMLFGLSLFIQLDRGSDKGVDLRGRLLWRLLILAGIGYVDALLFCGDILMIIAVLGIPLVALCRLRTALLLPLAIVFALQVPAWWTCHQVLNNGLVPTSPVHWGLYGSHCEIYAKGSLGEVLAANATTGQTLRFWFTYESNRYLQMFGLFLTGYLLGRARIYENPLRASRFSLGCLLGGIAAFASAQPLASWLVQLVPDGPARYTIGNVAWGFPGLAQISLWMGLLGLLCLHTPLSRLLAFLAPFGRTSLSSYILQGWFWVPIYYGFGFGLHDKLGATWSLLLGLPFLLGQITLSHYWLKHFHYGPVEWLWRCLTLRHFKTPFKRRQESGPQSGVRRRQRTLMPARHE